MLPDRIVTRARRLIGSRFRLHGRDPETGLDCVGLVGLASGKPVDLPSGYPLRGGDMDRWCAWIDRHARRLPTGALRPGALVMLKAGPAQLHLGIWTGISLIHADAGLRKVVERAGDPPWPVVAAWTV